MSEYSLLESDVSNPNFSNPRDPDSLLFVEFFLNNPVNKWASEQKSVENGRRTIVNMHEAPQPYVRIASPGDGDKNTIVQKVREDHKRRFPRQWLSFAMENGLIEDTGATMPGFRIEEWDHLNPEQVKDLKHMRFHTVEQIAGASDLQVQGMGIMGPGLREEARKALRARVSDQIAEVDKKRDEEMNELRDQIAALQSQLGAKKPGRPRKDN